MTLSKEQIEAIQARAEKALEGPWSRDVVGLGIWCPSRRGGETKIFDIRGWGYLTGHGHGALGLPSEEATAIQKANGDFVAHARIDIPALCQQALRAIELEAEKQELAMQALSLSGELEALQSELTAARNALEEERERCAKVCDSEQDEWAGTVGVRALDQAADCIRALPSPQVKE